MIFGRRRSDESSRRAQEVIDTLTSLFVKVKETKAILATSREGDGEKR